MNREIYNNATAGLALVQGDAAEVLKTYPDQTFNTCVTNPPYWNMRDYGCQGQIGREDTVAEYIDRLMAVFDQVWRVLRNDGTAWINMGDTYASHGGHTKAGDTARVYNTQQELGMHGKRNPPQGMKSKDLIGMPWRVALALQDRGWYLRRDIIWHKPNPMPESVTDRPTNAHEYIFLLAKSEAYYYDAEAIREPAEGDHPRNCRGYHWHPPGQKDHNGLNGLRKGYQGQKIPEGWNTGQGSHGNERRRSDAANSISRGINRKRKAGASPRQDMAEAKAPYQSETRNKRDVWTVACRPFIGAHFATFPVELIEPCIRAGAPEQGQVLDPFAGAATTLVAAYRNRRKALGIELSETYIREVAIPRLEKETAQQRLI